MKKILVGLSLGALLVVGFAFVENTANDLSFEREPSIFSIQQSTVEL